MASQALIITGMHRSGTSLIASIMQAAGVDIGEKLLVPGPHNRKGYFEDALFYDLSRRILTACCSPGAAGFHEIGWMDGEEPDFSKASALVDEAKDLISRRVRNHPAVWGWKDPRTTLLLPFWDRILPEAKYLFVYRQPWSVVTSFLESEQATFQDHPGWPARIWLLYNERLMNFLIQNRSRCLLVAADAVSAAPRAFVGLLKERFGLPIKDVSVEERVDASLLRIPDADEAFPRLFASCFKKETEFLKALESQADMPGGYRAPGVLEDSDETKKIALEFYSENRLGRGSLKEAKWDIERISADIEAERASHREVVRLLEEERSAHAGTRGRLDAEAAAHAEKSRLMEEEQSAHSETRTRLDAETAAHAEKARLLELEKSARADTQAKLDAETAAHAEKARLLKEERSAHAETRARLDAEAADHVGKARLLELEKSARADTQAKLDAEAAAHAEKARLLEGERSAHAGTRGRLDAEAAAHAEKARLLEEERSAYAETRAKLDAEASAHTEKTWLLDNERAAHAATQEQLDSYRSYLATLRASRFWNLRAMWFKLRRVVGIKTEINDL